MGKVAVFVVGFILGLIVLPILIIQACT